MNRNPLCLAILASLLYFVLGCNDSKNVQAVGVNSADIEAEQAVIAANEITDDELEGADAFADENAAIVNDNHYDEKGSDNSYEDKGAVNPFKQLVEGEPIEVSYNINQFNTEVYGYGKILYNIVIQAKTDQVVVNNVIINRGNNCSITTYDKEKKLPAKLTFGNMVELSISCDPTYIREVEVKTNYENYQFGSIQR